MKNGLLIFSAPSGSGKSTIVNWLMKEHPELKLAFSISCTSRAPRGTEQNGVEYFFLSPEEFKAKIKADEFLVVAENAPVAAPAAEEAPVEAPAEAAAEEEAPAAE